MKYLDLRECYTKEQANILCGNAHKTIKDVCIENINGMIDCLTKCRDKIENGEKLQNEDWSETAVLLSSIVNALGNHWYYDSRKHENNK